MSAGHRKGVDRFLVVAGFIAVGFEIAEDSAFDDGRGEVVAGELRFQVKGDVLNRFGFQVADGGPAQAAHFRGIEFFRLACSRKQHAGGAYTWRMVYQGQFERLPGDLPGVEQVRRSETGISASLEDGHDQGFRLHLAGGFAFYGNLHTTDFATLWKISDAPDEYSK